MSAQSTAWRALSRVVLGGQRYPGLTILIFHRVLAAADPLRPSEPTVQTFSALLEFLASRFEFVALRDGIELVRSGKANRQMIAVTFDDGYLDNLENALPVMSEHGVPGTFFIASDVLQSGIMWNDRLTEAVRSTDAALLDLDELGLGQLEISDAASRRQALRKLIPAAKYCEDAARQDLVAAVEAACGGGEPPRLMMNEAELRRLASSQLTEIGGHTINHPILAEAPDSVARREIEQGKADVEAVIGASLSGFAYPNGLPNRDYKRVHVDMARAAGFEYAVSTSTGSYSGSGDLFQLPRISPWNESPARSGIRMLMASRQSGVAA